jgi:hypothetical protein
MDWVEGDRQDQRPQQQSPERDDNLETEKGDEGDEGKPDKSVRQLVVRGTLGAIGICRHGFGHFIVLLAVNPSGLLGENRFEYQGLWLDRQVKTNLIDAA